MTSYDEIDHKNEEDFLDLLVFWIVVVVLIAAFIIKPTSPK